MLFCIVGVTVTVASDSERTYHVAVCEALASSHWDAHANFNVDRGLPRRRSRLHYLIRQFARILVHRCLRSCGRRVHPAVDDRCKHRQGLLSNVLLTFEFRSSGSSTTGRSRKPVIAPSSTRMLSTRRIPTLAARARCRTTMLSAQTPPLRRINPLRCIHLRN